MKMPEVTLLNNLLIELQNTPRTVAVNSQKAFTGNDFISDCSNLINVISRENESDFILSCKNAYNFALGLFSLLHLNKKICLPPGMQKGLIDELSQDRKVISDFYPEAIHPIQEKSQEKIKFSTLLDGNISLFTSGSTGERKEIKKTLSQFNEEIYTLNKSWDFSSEKIVLSSVSHQHIYGLLFKILWPLATQRAFFIDECMFEDDLNKAFSSFPESILISCPAHLDAMARFKEKDFLKNRIVFSSGAPLSLETAKDINASSGNCPIEVFGSTETGGIAWRLQTEQDYWNTFSNVSIRVDEKKTLSIKSPFCEIQNEWYETGDKSEILSPQSFKHLGRKDRIVKVSGKRLSLNEMELQLSQSELIESCKVLVLAEKGQTNRESTALIAVLTNKGSQNLSDIGRRKFALSLKAELKKLFPAVVIPRFWRYIDQFPTNSQGKIENELLPLFLQGYNESEKRFPILKSIQKQNENCSLNFLVPENCDFFDGHFPENPILPGVGQIFWAQFYTEKLLGFKTVKGINKLKFHHVIQPNELCTLELEVKNNSVNFTYSVGERLCSAGSINYG